MPFLVHPNAVHDRRLRLLSSWDSRLGDEAFGFLLLAATHARARGRSGRITRADVLAAAPARAEGLIYACVVVGLLLPVPGEAPATSWRLSTEGLLEIEDEDPEDEPPRWRERSPPLPVVS